MKIPIGNHLCYFEDYIFKKEKTSGLRIAPQISGRFKA